MINESSRAALLAQMQQMAAAANVEPGMAAKPAGDPVEFSSMLKRVVDQVNEVQQGSEQLSKDFVLGDEQVDIAEVMIVAEDVPKVAGDYANLIEGQVTVLRDGIRVVDTADARLSFRTPRGYRDQYGDLASEMGGRSSIFGAVIFRTTSLPLVANLLETMDNPPPATIGPESIVIRMPDYDSVLEFVGSEA